MSYSIQDPLPGLSEFITKKSTSTFEDSSNLIKNEDKEIHEWYRFVLSFPPHLVRHYLREFDVDEDSFVLDPFCGTGTTIVESRLAGYKTWGVEAHPFSHFASSTKISWEIEPQQLLLDAEEISQIVEQQFEREGIDDFYPYQGDPDTLNLPSLDEERAKLLIKDSISPIPLRKVLYLISVIDKFKSQPHFPHLRLALANTLVQSVGNLRFGPEVGVGKIKEDAPVISPWLTEVRRMVNDLENLPDLDYPYANVSLADARELDGLLPERSVGAVITSPPYPNEKDYTRTTRLESVLLGFINSRKELRQFKKGLVRSNTRGVYKADTDDTWIEGFPEVLELADAIEERRKVLGKTSGFERTYHRVTKLYFGGMARHLSSLKSCLIPGAKLAYVVGDQASYLRVMIRTGTIIARIASKIGYEVEKVDLFRKRFATATSEELREEVVVLNWSGG